MSELLDTATLPLRGRHLIEASAGTGKTFTVANLYVRLLIDARKSTPPTVDSILVVTFTKAATEELRRRLLERIRIAIEVVIGSKPEDADETLHAVLQPHLDIPETRTRLEEAYRSMDQAAIFTIDSFCDRVLRSQAFESGELFDSDLLPETGKLNLRAAEAWWRKTVNLMNRQTIVELRGEGSEKREEWKGPARLLEYLSKVVEEPDGRIVPTVTQEEQEKAITEYQSAFHAFVESWKDNGNAWIEQLKNGLDSKHINKGKVGYTSDRVEACGEISTALASEKMAPADISPEVWLLGNSLVGSHARSGKPPCQSATGACIDALEAAYSAMSLGSRAALIGGARDWIYQDLSTRKHVARQRTFRDSLLKVYGALNGPSSERLTALLRAKYQVGMIDEFQDTDHLQFDIFDCIFPSGPDAASALYLIGDPKQSIYRFRGADIDAYLHARITADGQYPLDRNWRSSSCLLGAVNALYLSSGNPFGAAEIKYQEVSAGGAAEDRALQVDGRQIPPLQFDYIHVEKEDVPAIDESRSSLADACARRVAWLLENESAMLGQSRIKSNDIAILVWTHKEAELIRQSLSKLGFPSAVQSRENVFKSTEVLDILAFLRALSQPGDSASLSRVLVSPLGGLGAAELLARREDAARWQHIEECIQRCREQYGKAGPLAALLSFMKFFNTRVQALATPIAQSRRVDRVLGNYLHLADALQNAWQTQPDLRSLMQTTRRWREEGEVELVQLRLESDSALVQIVTVHKSKGMEYPIVMLPFACMGRAQNLKKGEAVPFLEDNVPCLDVGSDQFEEREDAYVQSLEDETLRTLYVALTRAEQSIWIGVTPNKNAKNAALWNMLGLWREDDPLKHLQSLAEKHPDNIEVTDALVSDSGSNASTLACQSNDGSSMSARFCERKISPSWRVGSYTALARGATIGIENPDHDAIDAPVERPDHADYHDPFHFPRGASAGTLVHDVFEHLDFKQAEGAALDELVANKLGAHGIDVTWAPALCRLVKNTLNTPLGGAAGDYSLSTLDRRDRIDELQFNFPVNDLDAKRLVTILRQAHVMGPDDNLQFDALNGFMTGFIDLIFRHEGRWYIADYKSNHLGYQFDNYTLGALRGAMRHHRYDLQYLIYAVALRRYLKVRVPDLNWAQDFGGVYYLFVRGMEGATERTAAASDSPTGVLTDCPPESLLQELDDLLSGVHNNA